jgi:hypothetical protein
VLFDPPDVGQGVVQVVEKNLADPGSSLRIFVAPVHEPTVMGTDPGQAMLIGLGWRRRCEENKAREERRDCVGEEDLGHDAVGFLLRIAHLAIPIAEATLIAKVAKWVLVLASPGVEVLEVCRFEILPILGVTSPGVAVRRNDREALGRICALTYGDTQGR